MPKGQIAWNKGISTKDLGKSRPVTKKSEKECLVCHSKFISWDCDNRATCSIKCSSTLRGSKICKDKHYKWKGGVTLQDRLDRVKFRSSIQKLVLERDNYTCQICDGYSGNLQVDHIKRWSDYPELRFDITNCRTLCMACHYYITFRRKIPEGIVWGHNLSKRIA